MIANVADLSGLDIDDAIEKANVAFQSWKNSSCKLRSDLLKAIGEKLIEHEQDLATIMVMECGKVQC